MNIVHVKRWVCDECGSMFEERPDMCYCGRDNFIFSDVELNVNVDVETKWSW